MKTFCREAQIFLFFALKRLKDGSCSRDCPAPLIRKTEISVGTYCLSPCQSEDYFISGEGLCGDSCPSFFHVQVKYGVKYCLPPCRNHQYYLVLYKSCVDTCPFPLKIESVQGAYFCQNPCSSPDDFLFDDQSCRENCPSPLTVKEGGFCKSPCRENEYVSFGGCQEHCEYPDLAVKEGPYQICKFDETAQIYGIRRIIKISNSLSEVGGILSFLGSISDPTSILMMPLLNMFEQVTMIEDTLPVQIKVLFNGEKNPDKSHILVRLQDNLDHHLMILGILCGIYLLVTGMKFFINSNRRSQVSQLLHSIWSIFVLMVISMNGNTVLYLTLSEGLQVTESPRTLVSLIVVLFPISVAYKIIIIRGRQPNMDQEQQNVSERWRFFFEIYKSDGLFLLIYLIRLTFFSLIIGCLSEYPHVQLILTLLTNIAMFYYLTCAWPIVKKICFIQHMILEAALMFYNGVFATLVVFDLEGESVKNVLSQVMIILYLIVSLITALIILMKLICQICNLVFKTRGRPQTGHIELREFSQSSEEEGEANESFEQQQEQVVVVDENAGFREINQEDPDADEDAENDLIEANIVIE